jgi:Cys-tRNA(Pro) deacylase
MRTSVDVHNYLQSSDVPHEIFLLETSAKTAERAAALLGLRPSQITKVILFMVDNKPNAVLLPGDRRVHYGSLKKEAGTKNVRLATPAELLESTDYPMGATPPVALKKDVPVWLDQAVMESEILYSAAGELNAFLKMRCADLARLVNAKVAPLCRSREPARTAQPSA